MNGFINYHPVSSRKSRVTQCIVPKLTGMNRSKWCGFTPVLHDFYLADISLRNVYIFRDPFNTLTSGSIHKDPVDNVHSYVGKMRVLLEKHKTILHPNLYDFEDIFFSGWKVFFVEGTNKIKWKIILKMGALQEFYL